MTSQPFEILDKLHPDDVSLPTFMVSRDRGFLPRQDPLVVLPAEFEPLETLLQEMPITKADGTPGLLAQNKLGVKVQTEFPNLVEHIEKYRNNQVVISALYRDYSFLASAYLLEPCHHEYQRTNRTTYGLARDLLPENIAVPIAKVAELAGFMPFMEYAGSYALANWKRLDPSKPVEYGNLALIRAFENGLDRESSEAGFVLVHVDMVRSSGPLVAGAWDAVEAVERGDGEKFEGCLREMLEAIQKINGCMENMWNKSKPRDYGSFRTFIFGITKQSMFPRGVIYEGVSSSTSPTRQSFRGESGANDSIIPLLDIFLDIPYPHTPLTEILLDFRKYRPGNHREFLEWMHRKQEAVGMRKTAMKARNTAELWLRLADQVREFRWRHWCFTREYVLKESRHPVATGGSPIVNWLPNQLFAVLAFQKDVIATLETLPGQKSKKVEEIEDIVARQEEMLKKEVRRFCVERGEELMGIVKDMVGKDEMAGMERKGQMVM